MYAYLKSAICLAALALLVACTSAEETPTAAPASPTPTDAPVVQPTATPTPSPTATSVPTPSPTATPLPTVAPPTATPVPSPTPTEAPVEEKVLTILYWQAPSLPGPYLSAGYKDRDAGAVTLEPLAKYSPDGDLVPALAAEIPTIENGGVSEDLMSITWRLREGLKWSDGSDVTAEDVVFTWRYCSDVETGCTAESSFDGISSVEAIDALTVRVAFDAPTPYPYTAFVSTGSPIISRTQFADCVGKAAAGCEAQNTAPLGTGPYRIIDFTPNEDALYERNPYFRGPAPYFDRVVIKGGGDATSTARAVLEKGEADYAWNLQVAPGVLTEMETAGHGVVVTAFASTVERIIVNQTNPDAALEDDRSEYLGGLNPHPFLTFTPIPRAMSMAIDRALIAEELYGFAGEPTCNIIAGPSAYVSTANDGCLTQDIQGAISLLEDSGVLDTNDDGVREYNGYAPSDYLPDLHQRHPPGDPGPHSRLVEPDRNSDGVDTPRRQPVLWRRPCGRQGDFPSQVLRRRADVHHRPGPGLSAAPVRLAVQAHPHS